MLLQNPWVLTVLLSGCIVVQSCTMLNERPSSGPIQLRKPIRTPGLYAYRRFDTGPFRNFVEVFDLESRESIGKLVASEQLPVVGFALTPMAAKGVITLFEIPGILYLFDLQKSQWSSNVLQRAPLGHVVVQTDKSLVWLSTVGIPEILGFDMNSERVSQTMDLAIYFEKPLPYMAISPDNKYLAVLGNSGQDVENRRNLNSLLVLQLKDGTSQFVMPLGNYPVNPKFSADGRFVCVPMMFEKGMALIDIAEKSSTFVPLPIDSLLKPSYDIFSIAVHPTRQKVVASVLDLSNPDKGPLNLLVIVDLEKKLATSVSELQIIVSELSFCPDGSILYASTPNGIAALDANTFAVLFEVESRLGNAMVKQQSVHTLAGELIVQELR